MSTLPKILVVKDEIAAVAWNKSLPVPLKKDEKVIVESNQDGVHLGFVRIRHSGVKSVFSIGHFTDIRGNGIKK